MTGDLGFNADFEEVFGVVDTKLLLATVLLVLRAARRDLPLAADRADPARGRVASPTGSRRGLIYLYAKSGTTVSSNSTSILVVLMFGVGTDYCLLLVSRYREELRRVEDKHEAMARALRRAGPAILASGCTVIAAMLVLLLADTGSTRPRPVVGDRRRVPSGRRAHAAAGAAHDLRSSRVLAAARSTVAYDPDVEPRRAQGHLAALRRPGAARPGARARRDRRAVRLLRARPARIQGGLQRSAASSRSRSRASRASRSLEKSFPRGRARADGRPRRAGGRRGHRGRGRGRAQALRSAVPGVASVTAAQAAIEGRRDREARRRPSATTRTPTAALARVDKLRDARQATCRPGVTRAGRRRQCGAGGLQPRRGARPAGDRPGRAARDRADPRRPAEALVAPIVLIATVMASFFGTLGPLDLLLHRGLGDAASTPRCRRSRSSSSSRWASTTRSS